METKLWKDNGDNVGVECLVCHRTHWNESDPATNPITHEHCDNCQVIKELGILVQERAKHNQELEKYQQDLLAAEDENLITFECAHQSTQPQQAAPMRGQ